MSGLCGWFSREPDAIPVAAMAAPGARVRRIAHGGGTFALVETTGTAGACLYRDDGLAIVHWGERSEQPEELRVELLAQLWRSHGADACAALAGRFAFALFDERRDEGLLAVDRCASLPLFYQCVGRRLVFASSMEALARHPGAGCAPDPQALFNYLYLGGAAGPRPMLEGQQRLPPGERLHLHNGRVERSGYWRMRHSEHVEMDAPHAALVDVLAGAVAPDGEEGGAGVLFGGGPGSAILTALLGRATAAPVHTYALGYGHATLGHMARIAKAARSLGSRHRELLLGPRDIVDAVPVLADAADGPCGDPAAVGMLFAARMAREDGMRSLHGAHGGAVLFGLGRRYGALGRGGRYERLPGMLRQLVIEPLVFGAGAGLGGQCARLRGRIEDSMAPPPQRLRRANALLAHGAAAVFKRAFLAEVDLEAAAALQEEGWWLAQARSPVNRAVELEQGGDLPYRVLPACAAACAGAGLALRLPFLDDAVVALTAQLLPRHKRPGPAGLLLLRALRAAGGAAAVAAGQAPALPFGRWLREDAALRALAGDSLSGLGRRHILRREFVDLLLSRRLPEDPDRHGALVWQLMMLEQWLAGREGRAARPQATAASAGRLPALQD